MISNIALSFSLISGIMSCLLFIAGMYFEKNKKKSTIILLFACLFLLASFTGLEWAFWLEGKNMFYLLFSPIIPLIFYFFVWFVFIIWLFESRGERKIWILLILIIIIIILIAVNCMNCLHTMI